jgi:hypothetical protein
MYHLIVHILYSVYFKCLPLQITSLKMTFMGQNV